MPKTPIHPISSSPLIPIILTHGPTGIQQTYWISLKRFMEERAKGTPIQRIQREDYTSVKTPGKKAEPWEIDFIENLQDFGIAGLTDGEDHYEVELITEVRIKKNDVPLKTYQLKVNKSKIAQAILNKILGRTL